MKHASTEGKLANDLLCACRLARQAGFPGVAEHVLSAIEELVRRAPAQRSVLDAAYLDFVGVRKGAAPRRQ